MGRGRFIERTALTFLTVAMLQSAAQAQSASTLGVSTAIDRNILTGGGPATTAPPVHQPYFLGWSVQIGAPAEILKFPHEPGGLCADPDSGWVYVGGREGHVVALEGGKTIWSTDVGGVLLAAPTVYRNYVIVGTAEGVLHILNKVTGGRVARAILGEELVTQPVVAEDASGQAHVYVGSNMESLFAVNVEDGLKLWRSHRDAPSGFTIYGFARPIVTKDYVYAGFADGTLVALDPASGVTQWEKHLSPPGDMQDIDGLACNGAKLFAASYSGGVFAVDPATGDVLWQTKLPQINRILTDGFSVYAGGPGLWARLNANDGKVVWKYAMTGTTAPSIGSLAGTALVFAEEDGPIYFVDTVSGKAIGVLNPGEGFSGPPMLTGNVMFAESNYGRVYSAVVAP